MMGGAGVRSGAGSYTSDQRLEEGGTNGGDGDERGGEASDSDRGSIGGVSGGARGVGDGVGGGGPGGGSAGGRGHSESRHASGAGTTTGGGSTTSTAELSLDGAVELSLHVLEGEAGREGHGRDALGVSLGALNSDKVVSTVRAGVLVNLVSATGLAGRDIGVEGLELVLNITRASREVNVEVAPVGRELGVLAVVVPLDGEPLVTASRGRAGIDMCNEAISQYWNGPCMQIRENVKSDGTRTVTHATGLVMTMVERAGVAAAARVRAARTLSLTIMNRRLQVRSKWGFW